MLASVLTVVSGWSGATPSSAEPALQLSDREKGGLVALGNGGVVLWRNDGRVQIRGPTGLLSPIRRLGLDWVRRIVPDSAGFLGWGTRTLSDEKEARTSVFLADETGTVRERWESSPGFIFSIATDGAKRWATVSGAPASRPRMARFDPTTQPGPLVDLLVELLPGGKTAVRGKVEMGAQIAAFGEGGKGRSRIDCVPADLSKSSYRYAYCTVADTGGWRRTGLWNRTPMACGGYLVEISDERGVIDERLPGAGPQVTVRSLYTGEKLQTRRYARVPVVACGASGEILVGGRDIRALSLPALDLIWRTSSPRGNVTALARGADGSVWVATALGITNLPGSVSGQARK